MKLCTFSARDRENHVGVAFGSAELIDVTAAFANDSRFSSMQSIVENEHFTLSQIAGLLSQVTSLKHQPIPLSAATLRVPLTPPQIRCFSVYEQHLINAFQQVLKHEMNPVLAATLRALGLVRIPPAFYNAPAYYKGARMNLGGHLDIVNRPRSNSRMDYEAELGVIVGKRGKDIRTDDAMSHVFGYVVFNDFSERIQLIKEMRSRPSAGPAKGKDFDGSNCIGPWIVTRDEIPDPHDLAVKVRVNGKERGVGTTSGMTHRVERIVSYSSWGETLHPGELLATGCVPNCAGIETWQFLQDGDVVEVEIDRIGSLRNSVGAVPK
jgi:2-keto-4-pentenoate hydratase/2-oxohepta-3-ene-1,7-dioic acid hydratase in catechol pathway